MSFNFEQKSLLSQCAESNVYECDFYGSPAIIKERPVKPYRHPILDQKIRVQRTLREARALAKCKRLAVSCPDVYAVDKESCTIVMERLQGMTVREAIQRITDKDVSLLTPRTSTSTSSSASASASAPFAAGAGSRSQLEKKEHLLGPDSIVIQRILHHVGRVVGALHRSDKIHGDLTTSNFILRVDPLHHPALFGGTGGGVGGEAGGVDGTNDRSKRARNDDVEGDKEFDLFFGAGASSSGGATSSAPSHVHHGNSTQQHSLHTAGGSREEEVVSVIDFGLVRESLSAEERAVDLYVLERALLSTHPLVEDAFAHFEGGYLAAMLMPPPGHHQSAAENAAAAEKKGGGNNDSSANNKKGGGGKKNKNNANKNNHQNFEAKGPETMKRLEAVRARGRKRSMIG